jgi:uncharacterized protein YeaO (DUF488 family)
MTVQVKRAYEPPESGDGYRVLVDRLWPRGLSKEAARLDAWLKELAPSSELRKWYAHDLERWDEFQERYRQELEDRQAALEELAARANEGRVTLVFAARDTEHNSAAVLRDYLEQRLMSQDGEQKW